MRRNVTFVFAGILTMALFGCGQSEEAVTAENVEDAITQEVREQTGKAPSKDTTPCEILDDEFVRAHFEIGPDVEISRSPSKYSPHPLCTVSWPKPNAAEIEERSGEAMMEYMQKKMVGEDVKRPSFRTTDEVSLTLYEPEFESPDAAMASFDSSMKMLSEGITSSHEDVEVTFQANLTPVEGVGDKAMWAAKMRQLSVVNGNRIFHVSVNTGAELEADLEKAKAVAKDVAAEL